METKLDMKSLRGLADVSRVMESDHALARKIAAGDTDAWSRFFDRYSSWAYRFAYRHLDGNYADAEDLCSDILLTAARSIAKFDPRRGDLDAWLLGLARHRVSRFCRSRRIHLPLIPEIADQPSDSETSSTRLEDDVQTRDVVNRALACLPQRQAEILVAKYVDGYTTDELAQRDQSTVKAMESLLTRARNGFRSAYNRLIDSTPGGGHHE